MYVTAYDPALDGKAVRSSCLFIGRQDAHLLVYRRQCIPFPQPVKDTHSEWLQFSDPTGFRHPCLAGSIVFYPPDQLVQFPVEADRLAEVAAIMDRIRNRLRSGKRDIYQPTLGYLLLKIQWLRLTKALRIKADGRIAGRLSDLLTIMERDIGLHRSVKHYAEKIYVSEHYLGELCKNELDWTFKEVSNILLTIKILDLFLLSDMNFSQIAFELGFTDQAHFKNSCTSPLRSTAKA